MKISKSYASIIFALILLVYVSAGKKFENGAVIFTGNEFHHEGLKLQQNLLQKGFDVHLVEVKPDSDSSGKIKINDWENSTLGQTLQNRYEKLLFIITGHGNTEVGVNVEWSSLLNLLEFLTGKSDNIFLHIDTCYSGNQTESFLKAGGDHLKIFTTSSSSGRTTATSKEEFNHTNVLQVFSGYYLHKDGDPNSAHTENFKTLNCNSTASDVFEILHNAPITINHSLADTRIFLHKGQNEKLRDWNLLPVNLHVWFAEKDQNVAFPDRSCPLTPIPYSGTTVVNFKRCVPLQGVVNTSDPISEWQLRTVDIIDFPVPNEVKESTKNVIPYSSILEINGSQCDIQNGCKWLDGKKTLLHTTEVKLGFYTNKNEIWTLKYGDDEFNFITFLIVTCSLIGAFVIGAFFIAYLCVCKAKSKRSMHDDEDPVELHAPYAPNAPTPKQYTYQRPTNVMCD